MTYFISGHRNITEEDFRKYYVPQINKAIQEAMITKNVNFVIGDCGGVDSMAQDYITKIGYQFFITVYHMFDKPRYLSDPRIKTVGGFKSDEERDAAMTAASDADIAFIGKGRWTSGTAQNILRRFEVEMENERT